MQQMKCVQHSFCTSLRLKNRLCVGFFVQVMQVCVTVWPWCQAAVFSLSERSNIFFSPFGCSGELCLSVTACACLCVQCKLSYVCLCVRIHVCVCFQGVLPRAVGVSFCLLYKQRLPLPGTAHCRTALYTLWKREAGVCTHTHPHTEYTPIHPSTQKHLCRCVQLCLT